MNKIVKDRISFAKKMFLIYAITKIFLVKKIKMEKLNLMNCLEKKQKKPLDDAIVRSYLKEFAREGDTSVKIEFSQFCFI